MRVVPVKVIIGVNGYGYIASGEKIERNKLVYIDDNGWCCSSGKYVVGIAASDSDGKGVIISRLFVDEDVIKDIQNL